MKQKRKWWTHKCGKMKIKCRKNVKNNGHDDATHFTPWVCFGDKLTFLLALFVFDHQVQYYFNTTLILPLASTIA